MKTVKSGTAIIAEPKRTAQKGGLMRAIDADALTEDCKRYLGTLNPDRDGKECTRIHWLIGVLENAPTIDPESCGDAVSREAVSSWLKQYGQDVLHGKYKFSLMYIWKNLMDLPSVQPETDCAFKEFGNCSYSETGCSDCKVKAKIRNALSAQPEPCEDAVSRKTAIEAVMDLCKHYTPTKSVNHPHVDFVIEALQDLPSVTPKRKTGKWILLEECANAGYYCSECRKRVVREGWSGTVRKIKFCPNCGADMRSETEREIK